MKIPELKKFRNIAIVQTAFLGDNALGLYLAETIKNYHPECKLTFVTTPAASPLAACSRAVDYVIAYDKRNLQSGWRGLKFIAESLKEKNIDCLIALHRSFRTTLLSFISRQDYSVTFDRSAFSFLYDKRIKYKKHLHEIERNFELLKAFSDFQYINPQINVNFDISDSDKSFVDSKLIWLKFNNNRKTIAVAPSSVWETKKWPADYFSSLVNKLSESYNVALIGSARDIDYCETISENSTAVNLAGDFSLPQTVYFLSLCNLTITNDSAPTHFAGLAGCPALTIYGPTSPIFGFAPRGEKSGIMEINDLKCRPCAIHGGKTCPKKHFECMKRITPEAVLEQSIKILNL